MKREVTIIGNKVICDLCGKDYTNSDEKGGIYFAGKAVCPECTPRFEESIKKFHEEHFITARCPEDKSFKDWVIEDLRHGEPGKIVVTSF